MTFYPKAIAAFALGAAVLLSGCEQRLPNEPKPDDSPNPVEPQSLERVAPKTDVTPMPKRRGSKIYPAGGFDGTPYRYAC
jgi:hypothetical protein